MRLAKLNLQSLELRRLHMDLIYCYKIVFGLLKLDFADFLSFPCRPTEGMHTNYTKWDAAVSELDFFTCGVGGAENAGVENAGVENAGAITYGKPKFEKRLTVFTASNLIYRQSLKYIIISYVECSTASSHVEQSPWYRQFYYSLDL